MKVSESTWSFRKRPIHEIRGKVKVLKAREA